MNTIHIEVSNVLRIPWNELPENLYKLLHARLTFRNPLYGRLKRYGKTVDPEKTPEILFAIGAEDLERGTRNVVIPKGFLSELIRLCHTQRLTPAITDLRPQWNDLYRSVFPIVGGGGLTGEQFRVVMEMKKNRYGILEGVSGAGKRLCAIKLAILKRIPVLAVVHTRAEMYQWRELVTAKENGIAAEYVGLVGDGHVDAHKPITIAIGPSLRSHWDAIRKETGLLVIDRCDYASWSVIWKTRHFNCAAQWGLASGARVDGLTRMMEVYLGPRLVRLESSQPAPQLRVVHTEFEGSGSSEYGAVMKELAQDDARNSLITADILQASAEGRHCVVLSDRIAHLEAIAGKTAEALGPEVAILQAATGDADLASALNRFTMGKLRILAVPLKSVPLLDPVKAIDRLFVVCPIKQADYLMRLIAKMGEGGMIVEYKDRIPMFRFSLGRRVRVYRRMGIR